MPHHYARTEKKKEEEKCLNVRAAYVSLAVSKNRSTMISTNHDCFNEEFLSRSSD
jgi:hypothetical protein